MRRFPNPLHDVVPDRVDLTLAASAADYEIIGQQGDFAQVQQNNVAGLLLRGEIDDLPGEVLRLQPVRSYKPPRGALCIILATSARTGALPSQAGQEVA